MKTVVSAHARVRVFFTSCCFSLTLSLNEAARRIKTPVVHVRCDLTTHSTILSHVAILAMLSWNFRLYDYSVRLYDGPDIKLFILVGWGRSSLSVAWPTGVQLVFFFCSGVSRLFGAQGSPSSGSLLSL